MSERSPALLRATRVVAILGALVAMITITGTAFAAGSGTAKADDDSMKIVTVIAKDQIRSINRPFFVEADKARLKDFEPVIGIQVDGEARAYSTWLLNRHEIVNDQIGKKKFAVVW